MPYPRQWVRKTPAAKTEKIKVDVENANDAELRKRIMHQVGAILTALETEPNITWAQRLQAVNVLARLIFAEEKGAAGEPGDAGAAVKLYSQAFEGKAAGTGRRANTARSKPKPIAIELDTDDAAA